MRFTKLVATAVVGVIALAGCSAGMGGDAAPDTSVSATGGFDWKRFAGSRISVVLDEHPWTDGAKAHLQEFEDATGIQVDIKSYSEDLYFDKVDQMLRSQQPPDVYMTGFDFDAASQHNAGLMEPLTPYLDNPSLTSPDYDLADFPEGTLAPVQFPTGAADAQLFGIPISTETYILFYNKDLVGKYLGGELPTTMSGLRAAAAQITAQGGGNVFGSVMRGIRSPDSILDTMTGMVFNELPSDVSTSLPYNVWFDGAWDKPRLTLPPIVTGVSDYAALVAAGPPNKFNLDWPDASALFMQGKAAFYVDASVFGPSFEDVSKSKIAGDVGYATLPTGDADGTTGLWSWGLAMAKESANHGPAWLFLQWFTDKTRTAELGALTGGPPRQSAASDPAYTGQLNPQFTEAVKTAMATARPTAVINDDIEPAMLVVVDAMIDMANGKDPTQVMTAAQQKIKSVMHTG